MSGLDSLVRVHRWALDEKRRSLAEVLKFVDMLKADLVTLEAGLDSEREAAAASDAAAAAFPGFMAAVLQRRKRLRETIAGMEHQADQARESAGEAFRELKKFESALASQRAELRSQQARRERIELDELGVDMHRRRSTSERDPAG